MRTLIFLLVLSACAKESLLNFGPPGQNNSGIIQGDNWEYVESFEGPAECFEKSVTMTAYPTECILPNNNLGTSITTTAFYCDGSIQLRKNECRESYCWEDPTNENIIECFGSQRCSPNSPLFLPCSAENAELSSIVSTCNETGDAYINGQCSVIACKVGYELVDGECLVAAD